MLPQEIQPDFGKETDGGRRRRLHDCDSYEEGREPSEVKRHKTATRKPAY
jgi:hypothetical protein